MFVLATKMAWVWPIKVTYPTDDGFKDGAFRARFTLVPRERRDELLANDDPVEAILKDAVTELLDLEDDAGRPLSHSPELLNVVLGVPFMKNALWAAYIESTTAAPRKN